jgi:hypothetical protein
MIVRAGLYVDPGTLGRNAADLNAYLAGGETPIFLRGHHAAEGYVAVDPRPIDERDAGIIVERVRAFFAAGGA